MVRNKYKSAVALAGVVAFFGIAAPSTAQSFDYSTLPPEYGLPPITIDVANNDLSCRDALALVRAANIQFIPYSPRPEPYDLLEYAIQPTKGNGNGFHTTDLEIFSDGTTSETVTVKIQIDVDGSDGNTVFWVHDQTPVGVYTNLADIPGPDIIVAESAKDSRLYAKVNMAKEPITTVGGGNATTIRLCYITGPSVRPTTASLQDACDSVNGVWPNPIADPSNPDYDPAADSYLWVANTVSESVNVHFGENKVGLSRGGCWPVVARHCTLAGQAGATNHCNGSAEAALTGAPNIGGLVFGDHSWDTTIQTVSGDQTVQNSTESPTDTTVLNW